MIARFTGHGAVPPLAPTGALGGATLALPTCPLATDGLPCFSDLLDEDRAGSQAATPAPSAQMSSLAQDAARPGGAAPAPRVAQIGSLAGDDHTALPGPGAQSATSSLALSSSSIGTGSGAASPQPNAARFDALGLFGRFGAVTAPASGAAASATQSMPDAFASVADERLDSAAPAAGGATGMPPEGPPAIAQVIQVGRRPGSTGAPSTPDSPAAPSPHAALPPCAGTVATPHEIQETSAAAPHRSGVARPRADAPPSAASPDDAMIRLALSAAGAEIKIIARSGLAGPADRARVRRLADAVASEAGLRIAELTLDGQTLPAPPLAFDGDDHGR